MPFDEQGFHKVPTFGFIRRLREPRLTMRETCPVLGALRARTAERAGEHQAAPRFDVGMDVIVTGAFRRR